MAVVDPRGGALAVEIQSEEEHRDEQGDKPQQDRRGKAARCSIGRIEVDDFPRILVELDGEGHRGRDRREERGLSDVRQPGCHEPRRAL